MLKKIFIIIFVSSIISCGGKSDKKEMKDGYTSGTTSGDDLSANPDYQKGLALIGKSDCLTCHKVDERVNGPAYRDVANKYASAPDTIIPYLAGKVIKGGTGTWGQIFMTPHPAVTKEDAEAMVKYVLLLKNK